MAGIDIGAIGIELAVGDFSRKLIARTSIKALVLESPVKILSLVFNLLEEIRQKHTINAEKLCGIGIGIPRPVDFSIEIVVSPPIMPGWDGYPIIQTVQSRFLAANVAIDNDVNVMA